MAVTFERVAMSISCQVNSRPFTPHIQKEYPVGRLGGGPYYWQWRACTRGKAVWGHSLKPCHQHGGLGVPARKGCHLHKRQLSKPVQAFVDEKEAAANADANIPMREHMKQILAFSGPAIGIWLFNPVMSLVDTAVVGTASSLELAALGPGTALSDNLGYIFMFLSLATSNLIATAMANQDFEAAENDLAKALFLATAFGLATTLVVELFATPLLAAFIGNTTSTLLPPARTYVKIRGLAWPAALVTMVAQSASLGMQDAWGPLQVLAVAASLNAAGDLLLCCVFHYGIAGAAWATMASQVVGGLLMIWMLAKRGVVPLRIKVPSWSDLVLFMSIAGPTLVTTLAKVSFFTLMTYTSTARGTSTAGAHQVMLGIYILCSVFGEPLSQTAQSFIPSYITGVKRSLAKARGLLRSLLVVGVSQGVILGLLGCSIPWLIPQVFTTDTAVISQMRIISPQIFAALILSQLNLCMEGALMAGRDLKFLARTMVLSFAGGALLVAVGNAMGRGLQWVWSCLLAFQVMRLSQTTARLTSAKSVLGGIGEKRVAVA